MYLHSPFKWWFVRPPKPTSPAEASDTKALLRAKVSRSSPPFSASATAIDGLEQLASANLTRLPVTAAGASAATALALAPAQLPAVKWMLSPHQLGLDEPELLLAYDDHFCAQAENQDLFLAENGALTGHFFLDVQLLEAPEEASSLAHALWGEAPPLHFFRDLAYTPLAWLQGEVDGAARRAGVSLTGERSKKAAQLLQLHGLEMLRLELYGSMLDGCQTFGRDCSTLFTASEKRLAHHWLDTLSLGDAADRFLAAPGEQPVLARDDSPKEALLQFGILLGQYGRWLKEALTPPSERDPHTFYPPPEAYSVTAAPGAEMASFEMPPSYRAATQFEASAPLQQSNYQLFDALSPGARQLARRATLPPARVLAAVGPTELAVSASKLEAPTDFVHALEAEFQAEVAAQG